jgi:hypothetical protein
MHIHWLSVLLHFIAARFRGPARVVFLLAVWVGQAHFAAPAPGQGSDENAPIRHAVVEVAVTQHSGIRTVEVIVVERAVTSLLDRIIEGLKHI